ncbi:hypothetical protein UlMin_040906 [Ulmus minor]
MAGPSWLVDSKRIATKIKSASGFSDAGGVKWKSNPTRACPSCQHVIDNSDVTHEWPGLPKGVKFDPSDQEIIWHLIAKSGEGKLKPHPFIDEFIPTVNEDDGICYVHPRKLPGVKQDGSVSHFFHRAIKAYNTGTRKRRKIQGDDCDVRWHKTGRTKPVILDGVQRGCKKIMVLYMSVVRGSKAEKTNWVMHQYHLGTEEDEKEGEYVISKVFYQVKQGDKTDPDIAESNDAIIAKVDPLTPKSVTPDPPRSERRHSDFEPGLETAYTEPFAQQPENGCVEDLLLSYCEKQPENDYMEDLLLSDCEKQPENEHEEVALLSEREKQPENEHEEVALLSECEKQPENEYKEDVLLSQCEKQPENEYYEQQHKAVNQLGEKSGNNENDAPEDSKWWDSESQNFLDSQQLAEGLSLCDDLLQSQSPNRGAQVNDQPQEEKPKLADYAQLGPENLKKDLEECQNLKYDPANIYLDTPPDFRLSQLEFGSQDSFLAWGGKVAD